MAEEAFNDERRHPIVVGVDDSGGGRAALAFALEEAALRGDPIDVVHAWTIPGEWAEGFNTQWREDRERLSAVARERVDALLDECLAGAPRPPGLRVLTDPGYPPLLLLEAAKGARMLVVGSRGRGGFASMMLGSVSTAVVHHATCPVVVVRPADDPSSERDRDERDRDLS
ncbi:MAG TPA: universal stress protein [Acidimicrobiales bacterium]|nr:universal stress protein [Acidimicrobiales bacterium]